jgi:hypothetical protein
MVNEHSCRKIVANYGVEKSITNLVRPQVYEIGDKKLYHK